MILFRMPVYQPTLNTLELKEDKGTDYVVGWKSEGVYTSTLKGCVRYIFASLFCMSKREHLQNKEKRFLFYFKSSSCS